MAELDGTSRRPHGRPNRAHQLDTRQSEPDKNTRFITGIQEGNGAMTRRLSALLITTAVMIVLASTATAHGATVFYTACDAVSNTETVKVKKIEEDGSGAATVADTTVAYCGDSGAATRYLTGLAIHDGYAYFSWQASDLSTGIGRVGLDGKDLNLNHIAGPSGVTSLRINSAVHDGHLYAYVDGVGPGRIDRVPVGGGSFSNVVPAPGGSLSFGIANGFIYYANTDSTLYRSTLDGTTRDEVVFNSFGGSPAAGPYTSSGTGATLVAGSASTLFVQSSADGQGWTGVSTLSPASSPTAFGRYGAVPNLAWPASLGNVMVWSGSYLYFVQADSASAQTAIGRVKEDGTGLDRAWTSSARVLELAIGSMPPAAPAATPPAVKPTLKTTTIKKQTLYRMVNKLPETTVDCTTSNDQALGSCTVEITTTANALKKGKATKAKTIVIGKATKTSTAGSATITVKVKITNKRARAILKKGGALKATIKITATSTANQTSTASKATTLKAAKKKGKAAYRR